MQQIDLYYICTSNARSIDPFNHKKHVKRMENNELEFEGVIFPSAEALHEYRLIFDFEYFSDLAEQNLLLNHINN